MEVKALTETLIWCFRDELVTAERSKATIEKYLRDLDVFFAWLPAEKTVCKETVIAYKDHLRAHYATSSVNSMLAAVNRFLRTVHWDDCTVRSLKTQRRVFCAQDTELTKEEYLRLLEAASSSGQQRLYFIMQTICSTGIRVSELEYITVEALHHGRAEVNCKNKLRTIFLPLDLCHMLLNYAAEQSLKKGPVFVTRSGKPVNRSNVWADMQKLCTVAQVAQTKVFPHNLRHLFATTYYSIEKDIIRLADILGHSSIDTTRIYTISTGEEHRRQIAGLGLLYCKMRQKNTT